MNYIYRYLRHSDDVVEQPNSRHAQLHQIQVWLDNERQANPEFAKLQDAGEFWDADCSGGIGIAKRPAGSVMMSRVKAGDVILAAKWDRMFRDCRDFENTLHWLDAMKVRLVCVNMDLDTSTSTGRLAIRMIVSFGEFERKEISTRTKAGLAVIKHNKGVSLCPLRPPIGWKHARKHSVKRKDGLPYAVLVPDHEQREECRFIAKKHDEEGWSFGQIASYFERHHRKNSSTGLSKWSYYTIARRYKEFKAGFPAPPDCVEGRNTEQLTIEVQR